MMGALGSSRWSFKCHIFERERKVAGKKETVKNRFGVTFES